ncbi:MAG: BON domain-containing protein [Bryobacterales bacterium]
MLQMIRKATMGLALGLALVAAAPAATSAYSPEARTAEQVRKQIVTLPFYSIFDHVTFTLRDGVVTLDGEVYRPTLRKSAERVAMRVEGVNRVVNNIEVLPLSPNDDRLRLAVARSIFTNSVLDRYSMGANPSIHVIVRNGDVRLEGVVSREMERNVAGMMANGVPGVFSVTNNLRVAR